MSLRKKNWIVFYSKEDGAAETSLQNAESILNTLYLSKNFSINELIELYNIKLYFDNDAYLPSWSDATKEGFKTIIDEGWDKIKYFWLQISNDNIINYIEDVDIGYIESFWKLISYFQVYKKLDKQLFLKILKVYPFHIYHILGLKQIVDYFGQEVKLFLMEYDRSAELLLSKIEIQHKYSSPNYNFPNCLSLVDKENIISKYIDHEDANLNYIRIIERSKDSDNLRLSPKVRLNAKKKSELLKQQLFEESNALDLSVQVALSSAQDEPLIVSTENQRTKITYSEKYIAQLDNDIALFYLFRTLFLFTNEHGVMNLVSKENASNFLEKISIKSKNEYQNNILFERKNMIARLQIVLLSVYLVDKNSSLFTIMNSFVNDFLNTHYNINNLRIKFPSEQLTYIEQIRCLAPEIDSFLKQYQTYVNEGQIDFDLISIDSTPLRFSEIKSLVAKKYVYIIGNDIVNLKYHFFSDQSMLYYVEPHKDKYSNFYDLLINEDVRIDNFQSYQLRIINYLIDLGHLLIDADGFVRIGKDIFMYIVKELNDDEVLSYWYYPAPIRTIIDEMVNDGLLKFENTLFARPEINYLNYYLNKKEFTNGIDLRNKYLHGTNEISESINKHEYYILMKLIILIILKIEDDLRLRNRTNGINT